MSNYDALANFILLCIPLVAVVQVLNWWLCPLEEEGVESGKPVRNARDSHRAAGDAL